MKKIFLLFLLLTCSCGRNIRTAEDITPGNCKRHKLDWRYGMNDIRIQTSKLNRQIMDRWFVKSGYDSMTRGKPVITITSIDNQTDQYISTEMVRDIFEEVAVNDGRYTVTVGNARDERELDKTMSKIQTKAKYKNVTKLTEKQATAPHFLAKVRLTKAVMQDRFYDYETYRMTVTLYDIETQEIVDSASDTLKKRIK